MSQRQGRLSPACIGAFAFVASAHAADPAGCLAAVRRRRPTTTSAGAPRFSGTAVAAGICAATSAIACNSGRRAFDRVATPVDQRRDYDNADRRHGFGCRLQVPVVPRRRDRRSFGAPARIHGDHRVRRRQPQYTAQDHARRRVLAQRLCRSRHLGAASRLMSAPASASAQLRSAATTSTRIDADVAADRRSRQRAEFRLGRDGGRVPTRSRRTG